MSDNADVLEEPLEIESIDDLIEHVAGLTEGEYEAIRQKALNEAKSRRHAWVQKGKGKLVCTSCPFPHTAYIDPELRLIGLDEDGNPLFDKR